MNSKTLAGVLIALLFIVGAGYILYMGRPVMQIQNTTTSTAPIATTTPAVTATSTGQTPPIATQPTSTSSAPAPTPEPTPQPGTYTLADVQTHNTPSNCWAAVGSNVYDLTTWVSRHPGGENSIKGLCGTDGTARFERKHGGSNAAKAALALLKIGTLR